MAKTLSLLEEENLSEAVRNFPVLYDKSHKGYKERDAVRNAWNEVAASLDFVANGKFFGLSSRKLLKLCRNNLLRRRREQGKQGHYPPPQLLNKEWCYFPQDCPPIMVSLL